MIKNFKKGSYRMSAAAVICCVLAGGIVFTNGVNARDMKRDTNVSAVINKEKNKFLIDSPIKSYDSLKKAEKITGAKVKVPNYVPEDYSVSSRFADVIKISDKEYSLKILFHNEKDNNDLAFQVCKGNMEEVLKQIEESENEQIVKEQTARIAPGEERTKIQGKVELSKEAMNLGGIKGSNVTIKNILNILPEDVQKTKKFFIWENEGMWYSIGYDMKIQTGKERESLISTSIDEVGKIASSIKYIDDAKNVNYSAVKKDIPPIIYDKEDLKRAKELLGFDPKFPLSVNKNIEIDHAAVDSLEDSDIKNEKLYYGLSISYNVKVGWVTFNQCKDSKEYEDIKKKGNPIKIDGKEVFKYKTEGEHVQGKNMKIENYIWEENGIYFQASIVEGNGNTDEIAKAFVNSKPID